MSRQELRRMLPTMIAAAMSIVAPVVTLRPLTGTPVDPALP
jgi:hypothetical protein